MKGISSSSYSTNIFGCSIKGPAHKKSGSPCQDAWAGTECLDSRFVIAVADGLGSASHSHEGSYLATKTSVDIAKTYLENEDHINQNKAKSILREAFQKSRQVITDRANEIKVSKSAFNTTLLTAVATSSAVAGAAVGDGGIVVRQKAKNSLLIPREKTEYINETTPVQSNNWENHYRFGYQTDVDAVAVFSDGLDPFVWSLSTNASPRKKMFDEVFAYFMQRAENNGSCEEMCSFLEQEHFRSYSSDDKTLAVGIVGQESRCSQMLELFDSYPLEELSIEHE
jgi:hypothetical protein